MKLLLFFIDGLGLGTDDETNPARSLLEGIADVRFTADAAPAEFREGILVSADATGGVPGRPQSATGQAMLMTGINAPAMLGYHLTALPNAELVALVEEQGLMKTLSLYGLDVTASNLYTPEFFRRREDLGLKRGRNMLPVSALTIRSSGAAFRMIAAYERKRALFTDLTNRFLRDRGYEIPLITADEAAHRMAGILDEADFVFHEYFATDSYAHKKRHEDLERALGEINLFLKTLMAETNRDDTAILVVSDHGNCEDALSADHNRNPVPILLLSRDESIRDVFRGVESLDQVKGAIMAAFGLPAEDDALGPEAEWL